MFVIEHARITFMNEDREQGECTLSFHEIPGVGGKSYAAIFSVHQDQPGAPVSSAVAEVTLQVCNTFGNDPRATRWFICSLGQVIPRRRGGYDFRPDVYYEIFPLRKGAFEIRIVEQHQVESLIRRHMDNLGPVSSYNRPTARKEMAKR